MILFSVLGIGEARATLEVKTGDICVRAATAFSDFAGDTWIQNVDRAARGFAVEVIDKNADGSTRYRDAFLDDVTGCLTGYSIRVDSAYRVIVVTVSSTAVVSGVEVESWEGDSPASKDFETYATAFAVSSSSTFSKTITITDTDRRWTNLLGARSCRADSGLTGR